MSLEKINENLNKAKSGFGQGAGKSKLAHDSATGMLEKVNNLVETLNRLRGNSVLLPVDDSASAARRMAIYTGISHRSYEGAIERLQAAAGETPSNDHLARALQDGKICATLTSLTPSSIGSIESGVPMRVIAEGLDEIQKGLEMAARAAGRVSIGLVRALVGLEAAPNISNMVIDDITAYQNQAGLPTESYPSVLHIRHISNELPPF